MTRLVCPVAEMAQQRLGCHLSVIPAKAGIHQDLMRQRLNGSRVKPGMTAVLVAASAPVRNET